MNTFENANCAGYDVEEFFPLDTDRRQVAAAKQICAGCPLTRQCLEFAMEMETSGRAQRFGIYGGLSPRQRADLQRKRDKEAAA